MNKKRIILALIAGVLAIGVLILPQDNLENIPFYPKSSIVADIWSVKDMKEISVDQKGNIIYGLVLADDKKIRLVREKDQGLFSFEPEYGHKEMICVRTNRVASDDQIRHTIASINRGILDPESGRSMREKMSGPEGYKQHMNFGHPWTRYGLFAVLAFLFLFLCLPALKPAARFLKKYI